MIDRYRGPRFTFDWRYRQLSGTIEAGTRSEARAVLKQQLGLKILPAGVVLQIRAKTS